MNPTRAPMSSRPDDGGPAFPAQLYDRDSMGEQVVRESFLGMSLRHYIATQAMKSFIARGEISDMDVIAEKACRMADFMFSALRGDTHE